MTTRDVPPGLRAGGRFDAWTAPPIGWWASDIDGTLLGSDDQVSDAAAAAMMAAAATGLPVGLVTGRMRRGATRIHDRVPVPGPHVMHNGAEVRMAGETIASWPLVDDEVMALLALCRDQRAYCEFYTSETYWVTRTDDRAAVHWASLGVPPAGIVSTEAPPSDPIIKATFMGFDEAESDRLHEAVDALGLTVGDGRSVAHPGWSFLNVTRPGVDKAHALRAAADHIGVSLDNVAMIGDGHNDLPALRIVGTAVAMDNAGDDVKAVCHLVTDSVDDEGAGLALRALGIID
jgi:Cof subfamily protein (haloacid dehalogenase superfamily)